jgi:putative PIN family toxin of toxin-antitoxin system
MLRVVVDTNVIVSSVLSRSGVPALLMNAWRERRFIMVSSPAMIEEARAVLHYPHLQNKYSLTDDEIDQIISLLERDALIVRGDANVSGALPADPEDEIFLSCALDGEVDCIVSGDRHLLDLGVFGEIPILTVQEFMSRLEHSSA